MIRNIVFDLGNVLISFRPAEYLEKNNYPPEIRKTILTDIFGSQEWLLLDKGEISLEEAVERISGKSALKREEIALIFKLRTDIMFPLESNASVLPGLKEKGFRLYYLSNFPADIFGEIRNRNGFFGYFDGGIISAEVKHSKPDLTIFNIFFEKYNLKPEESLYIDDIEVNIEAARSAGMKGYCTYGSTTISDDLENLIASLIINS
jgi:putative hydrolase of the HAD superfamily